MDIKELRLDALEPRQTPKNLSSVTEYVNSIKTELAQISRSDKPAPYPLNRSLSIVSIDLLAIFITYLVAYEIAGALRLFIEGTATTALRNQSVFRVALLFSVPSFLLVALFSMWGHYNRRQPYWTEVRDIAKAVTYSAAATILILFGLKMEISRLWALSFFSTMLLTVPIGRLASRKLLSVLSISTKPTIVIGDGPEAFIRAKQFCNDKYLGLNITDYIDISSHNRIRNLASLYRYGPDYATETFGTQKERPHVVVAIENMASLETNKNSFDSVMSACTAMTFIPPISGIPLYNSQLIQPFKADTAVFRLQNNLKRNVSKFIKRAMDLSLCSVGLVLLSPIMFLVAFAVKLDGGPIVFGQRRIGQGGTEFTCWKFRSMQIDADDKLNSLLKNDAEARENWERDHKLKQDPRITLVGKFIRKTSLDELPQFWNVLKGEMSLVGPRPIVSAEIKKYGGSFEYYCESKPGVTGLWQISGRNNTDYDKRIALDVWYVRNWSPWLDLVIGIKTIPILFFRTGAY